MICGFCSFPQRAIRFNAEINSTTTTSSIQDGADEISIAQLCVYLRFTSRIYVRRPSYTKFPFVWSARTLHVSIIFIVALLLYIHRLADKYTFQNQRRRWQGKKTLFMKTKRSFINNMAAAAPATTKWSYFIFPQDLRGYIPHNAVCSRTSYSLPQEESLIFSFFLRWLVFHERK